MVTIRPIDLPATKNVFISAIRFATSTGDEPSSPFGNELKTSAQEQVEYMLGEDGDTSLVIADEEVKTEVKTGLCNVIASFENDLSSLLDPNITFETSENKIMRSLLNIEWMCNILSKIDLMKDFVAMWAKISGEILGIVEDKKLDSVMWGFKVKLIEVTARILDAVGYGTVIIPVSVRVQLLKAWLPYIRRIKPRLDSMSNTNSGFSYKMDEDLCQSIEGAVVSFILTLPSNEQAEIFGDWMKGDRDWYPNLSEAFEIWCYRTKSAKRRLLEGSESAQTDKSVPDF